MSTTIIVTIDAKTCFSGSLSIVMDAYFKIKHFIDSHVQNTIWNQEVGFYSYWPIFVAHSESICLFSLLENLTLYINRSELALAWIRDENWVRCSVVCWVEFLDLDLIERLIMTPTIIDLMMIA